LIFENIITDQASWLSLRTQAGTHDFLAIIVQSEYFGLNQELFLLGESNKIHTKLTLAGIIVVPIHN